MPGSIILTAVSGPLEGQTYEFNEHDMFIFGRAPDCHAQLPSSDVTASRHHFIIEVNPPDACIRDLGSLNGTYVNDTKYGGRDAKESPEDAAARTCQEVDLKQGDRIRVGKTEFSIEVKLPAKCCECGCDIAETEKEDCKWMEVAYLCRDCEKLQITGPLLRPPIAREELPAKRKPAPLQCKLCHKDVAAETGAGRRGEYVCKSCQEKAEGDPAELLMNLFLQHMEDLRPRKAESADSREIPGYEIGRMLGKGGMGAVYLARRKKDQADVALKVMLAEAAVNKKSRDMFEREINNMCSFQHDNIVALYDHGSLGTAFYIVMEFCPGGNLMDLMNRRGGKLSLDEAGPLAVQALEGLHYINNKGYVHRDLKPENILLSARSDSVAKVGDFGFTKEFQKAGLSGMTKTGQAAGTFPYMPREQLINFKYVKPVSDVWSMGATLYVALTGQLPRDQRRGQDPIEAILRQPVVPVRKRNSSIPRSVARVIDHSLQVNAKDRYQTAEEFRQALVNVL